MSQIEGLNYKLFNSSWDVSSSVLDRKSFSRFCARLTSVAITSTETEHAGKWEQKVLLRATVICLPFDVEKLLRIWSKLLKKVLLEEKMKILHLCSQVFHLWISLNLYSHTYKKNPTLFYLYLCRQKQDWVIPQRLPKVTAVNPVAAEFWFCWYLGHVPCRLCFLPKHYAEEWSSTDLLPITEHNKRDPRKGAKLSYHLFRRQRTLTWITASSHFLSLRHQTG